MAPSIALDVFVTGATGYLGRPLTKSLLDRGHRVHGLARSRSVARLTSGVKPVAGDALDHASFVDRVPEGSTLVQLVGVPHPSPAKAHQFREVDLVSARESVKAAGARHVSHFVYVSVARPAPFMKAFQDVRAEAEQIIRDAHLRATILRPWYILGPGHRWPLALVPVYALLARIPSTRDGALRLGLVTLAQMTTALVSAIERPPDGVRIIEVAGIRAARV